MVDMQGSFPCREREREMHTHREREAYTQREAYGIYTERYIHTHRRHVAMAVSADAATPWRALVVDTAALLQPDAPLRRLSTALYTVPEVWAEVRSRQAREHLAWIPAQVHTREPSDAAARFGARRPPPHYRCTHTHRERERERGSKNVWVCVTERTHT
jgi:hypothetical protein